MQRAGGLEVADAVMIDNAKDRGVLKPATDWADSLWSVRTTS